MLPKRKRLSRKALDELFASSKLLTVKNELGLLRFVFQEPSFAVSVSSRVAKRAVDRNRLRRWVYQEVEKVLSTTLLEVRGIFILSKEALHFEKEKVQNLTEGLIKKTYAYR